jgi:bifunctional non-homologous end joining protein LigD
MPDRIEVAIGRRHFTLTNPAKVLFPGEGVTKLDLVDYYRSVAPRMLQHLEDRPLMLERYPDGIDGGCFYQKAVPDYFPDWIRTVDVEKEGGGTVTHALCQDEATLAYLAGQACITLHTWLSRADRLDRPDRVVFDLDPSGTAFAPVRSAARDIRDLLTDAGLAPYVQTTGSRGLHVVVPVERRAGFDDVRGFAREVAEQAVATAPRQRTVEARKEDREGRVYIDVMRNAYAQTVVAPYAIRARPGAPAATPLEWQELGDRRIGPRRYNLFNMGQRLSRRDDPWRDIGAAAHAA